MRDAPTTMQTYPTVIRDDAAFGAALRDVEDADRPLDPNDPLDAELIAKLRPCEHNSGEGKRLTPDERLWNKYALIAEVCSAGSLHYDPSDVASWFTHAARVPGVTNVPRVPGRKGITLLHRLAEVPNAPFRDRYLELVARGDDGDGLLNALATVLGRPRETRYARRVLGLEAHTGTCRLFITYEQGVALAAALNLPPHACGV